MSTREPNRRDWSHSIAPVMMVPEAIEMHAHRMPRALAIVDDERELTWETMLGECQGLVSWLLAHPEVRRLAIAVGDTADHLVSLIGCLSAGVAAVPIDMHWSDSDLSSRFKFNAVDAVLIRAGDEHREELSVASGCLVVTTDEIRCSATRNPLAASALDSGRLGDLHLVSATGGTSGRLKACLLSHGTTIARIMMQIVEFRLPQRGLFLCTTPLFHGGGRSSALSNLYVGAQVLIRDHFEPARWLDDMQTATSTFVVPTMASRIIAEQGRRIPDQARVVFSGSRLSQTVARAWTEKVGGCAFNYYGTTESGAVSVAPLTVLAQASEQDFLGYVGFGVSIAPASGDTLPEGTPSQFRISGPSVCVGLEDEDGLQTTQSMVNSDLLSLDADGALHYHGRVDDVVISGGVNIDPARIEDRLLENSTVEAVAVVGLPDPVWGERLVAAVVFAVPGDAAERSLREWASSQLTGHDLPKEFVTLPNLPLTHVGKVDRRAIVASLTSEGGEDERPRQQ